jgi:hypothetical protein
LPNNSEFFNRQLTAKGGDGELGGRSEIYLSNTNNLIKETTESELENGCWAYKQLDVLSWSVVEYLFLF